MSQIVGSRYEKVIAYFKKVPFGTSPYDMTTLSCLPPIDRCLILEELATCRGIGDIVTWVDKLSMAYYKAGWTKDIPFLFLKACLKRGLINEDVYCWCDEKIRGLSVHNVSEDYEDAVAKLERYKCELSDLLIEMCNEYSGREILALAVFDRYEFTDERRAFINRIANSRRSATADSATDHASFLLNIQGVAFCYLLGGAKISNVKFASSANIDTQQEDVKEIWNKTLSETMRFAPYNFKEQFDNGVVAHMVSIEFPCYQGWNYQYRTSGRLISVKDVVDLMSEMIDCKLCVIRGEHNNGEKYFRFSWIILETDIQRLQDMFPHVRYQPNWKLPMHEVFHEMDLKLNQLAKRAVSVYPFMECEFTGW